LDKENKILLLVMVVVFIGTFVAGSVHYWPHPKEPVIVELDGQWPVGSYDFEVVNKIPLLNFSYEGVNYTTYNGGNGWFAKPIKVSPEKMKENVDGETNGTTFQKFLLGGGFVSDNPDTLSVMRVVVIGNNVRYSLEEVYSASCYRYELSFEREGNQVIVSHRPTVYSFLIGWACVSLVVGIIGTIVFAVIIMIIAEIIAAKSAIIKKFG